VPCEGCGRRHYSRLDQRRKPCRLTLSAMRGVLNDAISLYAVVVVRGVLVEADGVFRVRGRTNQRRRLGRGCIGHHDDRRSEWRPPTGCCRYREIFLWGASFSVVRSGALCPRFCLGHITALLGLAVPASAGAVVDLTGGVHPNLTGATGSRSGALGCGGLRLCPRLRQCVCRTGRLAP
jgi:hypothetical protein